ncbi:MAG TPA: hypothetical protein VG225_11410 [Terracidiphilus sp.]|jgi:hypothetical protein|nr:hypothetical protein [Terracidiphilus sp.]
MVILHALTALVAGFAVMTLLVIGFTWILGRTAPSWVGSPGSPRPAYALVNVGYSFVAGAAGGYVTAWIGSDNPLPMVLTLAIVVLAMAAISALEGRGKQPLWYRLALLVIMPVGAVVGGLLRLRVMGVTGISFGS